MSDSTDKYIKDRKVGAGLGRDLGSLLSSTKNIKSGQPSAVDGRQLQPIALHHIRRSPFQPRKIIDDNSLQELASSIKTHGVIQPIVVRQIENGYELIAGERRWRAAQIAGLKAIPAIINNLSDDDAALVALIENIQRENLNPIEEALALQRLHEEFILTHEQIAQAVGKSRTAVTNLLRLLKLNHEVKAFVLNGDLEMGHARALLPLAAMEQISAAKRIIEHALSVREAEKLVQQLLKPKVAAAQTTPVLQNDANLKALQNQLSESLCAKVDVQHKTSGKGKVVIHYNSLDELQGVIERCGITDNH